MSSHHFVRDGQEPALIIANGAECDSELLGQLLEWNPYVLVLDGALQRVLDMNIRVDAVLGDFDSVAPGWENHPAMHGVRVVHAPDQELTDLQKGIEFLIAEGQQAAHIVWATGRRSDHHFNNLATLPAYSGRIELTIIDDHSRIFNLPKSFKKWYPKDTVLSLIPVMEAGGIHTSNLAFALQDEALHFPGRSGSSNRVAEDGFVEIRYENGHLLLMECRD
ncbi:MAG: thiamine diphosphokinase [Sphingomonadales bacterium]